MTNQSLQAWYDNYLATFNAQDLSGLEEFLAPQIYFDWGGDMEDLDGREAFFAFYRIAWQHFTERVRGTILAADEHHIRALVENTIEVTRDWPDSPLRPYTQGEVIHLKGEMTYTLQDRKITRIA